MWSSCGGTNSSYFQNASDPSSCCPLGSHCLFYNTLLWRCVPDYSSGPVTDPVRAVGLVCFGHLLQMQACPRTQWCCSSAAALKCNAASSA